MSRDRIPWWVEPASALGAILLRVLGATWRLDRSGLEAIHARFTSGEGCIFALWHARLLPLAFTHRGQDVAFLVSRHRDGELIARIIERMGYVTARGSSTRGAEEGLVDMLRLAEAGHSLGITPDGPRGPAEQMKPGLVWLASRTGLPILPVTSAARASKVLRSWDRFRVPYPFARVMVAYGEPIRVPPGLAGEALEPWRERAERALREHSEAVSRRAGETA
jgi:lysophospholipid acyltransferase (LPLAT)-like uncharacterized protein